MKKNIEIISVMIMFLVITGTSSAEIFFQDDFELETAGLNYDSFLNWDVIKGTVDLIGNNYFDWWPGTGYYVDMDGSSEPAEAGTIQLKNPISLAAGSYSLSFMLAGNFWGIPGETDSVLVKVVESGYEESEQFPDSMIFCSEYSLPYDQGMTKFIVNFSLDKESDILISFAGEGGDWRGMMLDEVELSSPIPAPGAILLGGFGATIIGLFRRKRAL